MSITSNRFAVLLLALAFTSHASAALISFDARGTIIDGLDYANTFHSGLKLDGLAYTQSVTIDTDSIDPADHGYGNHIEDGAGNRAVALGKTTVNGHGYTWRIEGQQALAYLWNLYPFNDTLNQAGMLSQGVNTIDGQLTFAGNDVTSRTTPFLTSLDFSQTLRFDDMAGLDAYSLFTTNTADRGQTFFGGRPTSMLWHVQAVPEPATLGIFLLGLFLLTGSTRLRKQS